MRYAIEIWETEGNIILAQDIVKAENIVKALEKEAKNYRKFLR